MMGCHLQLIGKNAILHRYAAGEWLIEHHHKPVLEVLGYTAAVLGGIAYHLILGGDDFYVRTFIKGINHHVGLISLGEGKLHHGGSLGRSHLGSYIVISQIHAVIIGCGYLGLMREPAGTLVFVEHLRAYRWHQRELSVIVNPRTGLVGLLQAANLVGGIGVLPAIAILTGLCHPEVHAPRHGYGRVGVTC